MSQSQNPKKARPLPHPEKCEIANCPRKPRYLCAASLSSRMTWLCAAHLAEAIPESPLSAERVR